MTDIILVLLIVFFSSFVRSCFGFGDALLAMPLLSLFLSPTIATPLVAMIATSISIIILLKNWQNVDLSASKKLIISAIIGIPPGLLFITKLPESIIKIVLAIIIISFSAYKLAIKSPRGKIHENWAYIFGFIGGLLGGAYNTNGPPAVIYASISGWKKETFRASLQGYFLPTGGFILIGHGLAGLWTSTVINNYLYCLPLVIIAVVVNKIAQNIIILNLLPIVIFLGMNLSLQLINRIMSKRI